MPDLDRVIEALECCAAMSGEACQGCPYSSECSDPDLPAYGISHLAADALSLLKGHIMTPEEVEAVGQQEVVWVEIRRTDALYAAIREGNDFTTVGNDDYFLLGEVTECDDYLRWYRFWSARPSEERRHATPWEETDG